VIEIRMSVADLGRTRFAYSPLAEIAESLHLLSAPREPAVYEGWFAFVRPRLHRVDMALLTAVVPPRPFIADFLLLGAVDRSTTVEQQLQRLASLPAEVLRRDLEGVWRGDPLPPVVRDLVLDEAHGPGRLAEALWEYWRAALEPHWSSMRSVLDDDVAHKAAELTQHGLAGLLGGMHPELAVKNDVLQIAKRRHRHHDEDHELGGAGLLLVPSIFVWPNLLFAAGSGGPPSLTYPARGIGNTWGTADASEENDDALGALLGRSRAAILVSLSMPRSTTELALRLGQSPPSVSQHLSVLRRSALVVSWRSGRKVLYQRTALGDSVVEAIDVSKALQRHVGVDR
jgi:DNA-binding transcriptional ArsR family regulator